MGTSRSVIRGLPTGEQPVAERETPGPVGADTFAGPVHVEWNNSEPVTPFGQLPFFVEFVKQGGLFDDGGGLPAALHESERTQEARRAGHGFAVGAGRTLALRAYENGTLDK